ncbi:MAG: O-antigen ligase family protein, partial [Methylophaga sp.]|nr:O-antigen ligase family protein [Methylophaga sp.]
MTQLAAKTLKWTPPEILLAILFLLAPLYYHPNLGGEGLRIPHNITIWLVATLFIAYSCHKILKARQYVIPKYFWLIAAFPVLATLSGFIAGVEQPLKWLFRLLFIWGGLAFLFALFQAWLSQARIDRLLYLVVLSALTFAIVGIMQIWLKLDMPYLLPKNPDGIPSSFFQQINNQATYQVTAIFIAIYLSMRPWLRSGHFIKRITLLVAVLLAAYIVAISGSRIGALTLIISMLVVLPVIWRNWRRHRLVLGVLAAVVIGVFAGNLTGSDKLVDKTIAMQSGYSADARLSIYSISLGLIAKSPIVGHGIGSFLPKWQFAKPDFYTDHPGAKLPKELLSHPHNELMLWLVEGGVFAFIGMVLV